MEENTFHCLRVWWTFWTKASVSFHLLCSKFTPLNIVHFTYSHDTFRRDPFYSQFSTKEIKNPSSPTSPLKRKLEIKRTNNRKSHHIQHEPIHHNMNYNVSYNSCNCSTTQMMEEQVAKNSKKKQQNECTESNELPELLATEMLKLSPEEEWVLSVLSV